MGVFGSSSSSEDSKKGNPEEAPSLDFTNRDTDGNWLGEKPTIHFKFADPKSNAGVKSLQEMIAAIKAKQAVDFPPRSLGEFPRIEPANPSSALPAKSIAENRVKPLWPKNRFLRYYRMGRIMHDRAFELLLVMLRLLPVMLIIDYTCEIWGKWHMGFSHFWRYALRNEGVWWWLGSCFAIFGGIMVSAWQSERDLWRFIRWNREFMKLETRIFNQSKWNPDAKALWDDHLGKIREAQSNQTK